MTQTLFTAIKELNGNTEEAVHYGEENYVITVAFDTDAMAYHVFEERLRDHGYRRSYDNGDSRRGRMQRKEIYDYVRCSVYLKNGIECVLTYVYKTQTTYLCLSENAPASEHLQPCPPTETSARLSKTVLHNLPVKSFGNSFVLQLKNGHFLISDGGLPGESVFLLNYLKSLLPANETPVVEAWFISHLHRDHCGLIKDFTDGTSDPDAILVDGFYYSTPNQEVFGLDPGAIRDEAFVREAAALLKTSRGEHPKVYRPRMGQRFYFDDVSVDIVFTQEQLPRSCYYSVDFLKGTKRSNFNDSTTWCMLNVEEQKILLTGDADKGSMDHVMNMFDKEYFRLTAVDTPHHSWNPYMPFNRFIQADTVLVTSGRKGQLAVPSLAPKTGSWYYPNVVLAESAKEVLDNREGATVLEFPYTAGSYKIGAKRLD